MVQDYVFQKLNAQVTAFSERQCLYDSTFGALSSTWEIWSQLNFTLLYFSTTALTYFWTTVLLYYCTSITLSQLVRLHYLHW